MFRKLQHKNGFTLLELAFAMMIIAITGAALFYMFNQGQVLIMEQEHRLMVFEKAQKRMTIYKLLSEQQLIETGTSGGSEEIVAPGGNESPGSPGITADYETVIEASDGLYHVAVTYTWEEYSGRDYEVFLKSDFLIKLPGGS